METSLGWTRPLVFQSSGGHAVNGLASWSAMHAPWQLLRVSDEISVARLAILARGRLPGPLVVVMPLCLKRGVMFLRLLHIANAFLMLFVAFDVS